MRPSHVPVLLIVSLAAACSVPDPKARYTLDDTESYWAVGSPQGDTQFISPVVRFRLKNVTAEPSRAVQAQAVFRRVGDAQSWGSDWREVAPARTPIPAGGTVFVELRSDGRYNTTGTPESMLVHEQFRDATAEIFLREASSPWTKMADVIVERRIGPRSGVVPTFPASPQP